MFLIKENNENRILGLTQGDKNIAKETALDLALTRTEDGWVCDNEPEKYVYSWEDLELESIPMDRQAWTIKNFERLQKESF